MPKPYYKKLNIFIIFLLIFFLFFSRGLVKFTRNTIKLYALKKQKRELILENEKLKENIKRVKTNNYIEYVARVNYGLKRNIEIEYRFPPPEKKKRE